jgi:hypothetical protein
MVKEQDELLDKKAPKFVQEFFKYLKNHRPSKSFADNKKMPRVG